MTSAIVDFSRMHLLQERGPKPFLYPFPVVDNAKYLIEVETLWEGRLLELCLNEKKLEPDPEAFAEVRLHTDGQTPIFHPLKARLHLRLLPQRETELDHAITIEGVISRALFQGDRAKVRRLFLAQSSCSSCIPLGIQEPEVEEFLNRALKCLPGV